MSKSNKLIAEIANSFPLGDISDDLAGVFNDYFSDRVDSLSDDDVSEFEDDLGLGLAESSENEKSDDNPLNITDIPILLEAPGGGFVDAIIEVDNANGLDVHEVINADDDIGNILEDNGLQLPQHLPPAERAVGENEEVKRFLTGTCGCKSFNGRPCSTKFTNEEITCYRQECIELDHYEGHWNKLDLVVTAQIRALTRTSNPVNHGRVITNARMRATTSFMLRGETVCEKMYLFAHCLKVNRYKRIKKLFKTKGLAVNLHGNANKSPKHTLPIETYTKVATFIRNYAEQHALFLPGRVSTVFNSSVKLLPSHESKASVHRIYVASCEAEGTKPVSVTVFRRTWLECCPYIVVQRPMSDLCKQCQSNYTSLSKLQLSGEAEKLQLLETSKMHLEKVNKERDYYRDSIKATMQAASEEMFEPGPVEPCSYNGTIHYSFDMAQQVHVPSNPLQPGPIYFLTPYKLGLFGVMCDTTRKQSNFIIPESVVVSKGANFVVSLLHSYFETSGLGETRMLLHADNCVAQNKNGVVMSYLAWRVLTGLNEEITISFLPVGHTKFAVDWAFGLIKKAFRVSFVSSIEDMCDVINSSTPISKLNSAVPTGTESGDVLVKIFNWQEFFTGHGFYKIPKITSYGHFKFSSAQPGKVECLKIVDGESLTHTITKKFVLEGFPEQIKPPGLSDERKKYLYDHIREFCKEECKDLVCPQPRGIEIQEDVDSDDPPDVTQETPRNSVKRKKTSGKKLVKGAKKKL